MSRLIDLHIHSSFSDGQFNVKELVDLSKMNNVGIISITDHDNIKSVSEMKDNSEIKSIKYINGVELSSVIRLKNKNILLHILGYGFNEKSDELNYKLLEKRNLRISVNKKYLLDLINKFPCINEEILDKVQCDRYIRLSRLIEDYLSVNIEKLSNSELKNIREYLINKKPIYLDYDFDVFEAIEMIKDADGYPVLAHPYQYKLTVKEEMDLLKILKEKGLKGIEKYHSGDTFEGMLLQDKICEKFGFKWTAGSDFHEDHDDFGNEIGYGKNKNLCKDTCSLLEELETKGKVLKK